MLKLVPVLSFSDAIFRAYCSTFPEDERRSESQFLELFAEPKVEILSIHHEEEQKGYIIVWHLSEALFLEHFEVFSEFRGQNIGCAVLRELQEEYPKIVLETEPQYLGEIANRRVLFYQKNGFRIIDDDYLQPAYSAEKQSLKLFLMSNYLPKNIETLTREIHKIVYGVSLGN